MGPLRVELCPDRYHTASRQCVHLTWYWHICWSLVPRPFCVLSAPRPSSLVGAMNLCEGTLPLEASLFFRQRNLTQWNPAGVQGEPLDAVQPGYILWVSTGLFVWGMVVWPRLLWELLRQYEMLRNLTPVISHCWLCGASRQKVSSGVSVTLAAGTVGPGT